MSPREDDVLPTSTSVETYTRWWMAGEEERIGRNTKRPRYSAVRLRRRARRCREDGRPTWRERISCLVKFHGTMDGTCVAVCNLQPSFNQYSRYMYGPPERFPTLENSMRGILQASYVDRSESAVEPCSSIFFLLFEKCISHFDAILLSVVTKFTRSLAAFYESESEN